MLFSKYIKISSLLLSGCLFSSIAFAQVNQQMMDASADQAQGTYTPMNMGYLGFNSLGMIQEAWLDPMQNLGEGQSKPAYSRYYWAPDLVLPIRVREGMITLLNFPEWEMIEDIFIGDNATFDGQISSPNSLMLYPRRGANVGVDTNVIVFGRSGNRYVFYVKSEAVNTERLTNSIIDIEVVNNPDGSSSVANFGSASGGVLGAHTGGVTSGGKSVDANYTRRFQQSDWLKSIPLDPSKFRFDLEVYVPNPDDVVIAPERVWRDDIFTYIDLGKKSLNMMQRPVVSMIVERVEVPIGFRTKGPDNRLIIVEGVGDLVLRNGKRIICIKLRRSDSAGLEYEIDSRDYLPPSWEVSPTYPNSQSYSSVNQNYGVANNFDYSKMQRISNNGKTANNPYATQFAYGSGFVDGDNSNISVELGTDDNVSNLEKLWDKLTVQYPDELGKYEPFFSVDAPADGQGKELFHLRVGKINSLSEGDKVCGALGRNGVFCSVVRTQ